ncbi:MAG: DUF3445 domain-containing protein [Jiangellales bacterium]
MARPVHDPSVVVDGRPLRLTLGLRRLDLDRWLEVDADYPDEMTQKNRLLAQRPRDVLAYVPAGRPGALECLTMVRGWMQARHPDVLPAVPVGLHPIDEAGRLVQEDLCVLTRIDAQWVLTAASVCFPSRWRLAEKIGTSVGAIHDPVPAYHDTIGPVVDTTLDRLRTDRPVWRLNWSILDDDALFQPADDHRGRREHLDLAEATFRVERQTLRRLPLSGDIVFTIRTYRHRLPDVVASPERAADLAAMLRTCPTDLAEYKGWTSMLPSLLHQLDAVARHAQASAQRPDTGAG